MISAKDIKREQVYYFLLLVFLIALPIRVAYSSIAAIVLGVFFILDRPQNIKTKFNRAIKSRIYQMFLLYFFIQLIGLLYTENMVKGVKEVRQLIPIIILPLTILSEVISVAQINKLLRFFKLYIILLLVGLMVIQLVYFPDGLVQFESEAFSMLKINAFYYSAFIFIAIIITVFELQAKKFKSFRNYLEIILLITFMLLLGTRIAFTIVSVCAILFFFTEMKKVNVFKKLGILIILLSGLLASAYAVPDIYKKLNITVKNTDFDHEIIVTKNKYSITRNSLEYRYLINYCGWKIISENPFGVGTGDHQQELYKQYEALEFRAGKQRKFNAHNQYLSETIKFGYIGFLIFTALITLIFRLSLKQRKYLFYTIIYVGTVCLVESYFDRHHGVMFVAFFVPLLYYLENETNVVSRQ